MLILASLGVGEREIPMKTIELARESDVLLLEAYTTELLVSKEELERLIGREIREVKRQELEEESEKIIELAKEKRVCILVGGDALTATTHVSLLLEAKKRGIETKVVHGSSIYTAICETGLQIYKFGRTVTLPKDRIVKSVYDNIKENKERGLHTLVLLDIGLSVTDALKLLEAMEEEFKENVIKKGDKIVVCSRLGSDESKIAYGRIEDLKQMHFSTPAVLIIPGKLHFIEEEMLSLYSP